MGATLYALLTGKAPFESKSLPELVRRVRATEPRKLIEFQPSINELFQDLVLRMIAKQRDDRYQSPDDLLRELERIGRYNNLDADWSQ